MEKKIDDAALEEVVAALHHRCGAASGGQAGLQSITDGEFRRGSWFLGFVQALDGIELKKAELMFRLGGHEATWFGPVVTGKLARKRPIVVDDYRFLAGVTSRTPKVTLPTPSILHFFGGKDGMVRNPLQGPGGVRRRSLRASTGRRSTNSIAPAAGWCSSTRSRSRCCAMRTSAPR